MKIVIAPDSYKESLSAIEVAQAIEKGFREIVPDALYVKVPLADGGEGTVEAMIAATQGTEMSACVTGPLGVPVDACWGLSGDGKTAFIEMAAASRLGLVPPAQRNPLLTTSRGTGELILQALDHGAKNIIIGIGGSATNDGGAGMVQALGARLCDANGVEIGNGGGSLCSLNSIDLSGLDARLHDCAIRVACDVTNPLLGPSGASAVYGPQKGAGPDEVPELDAILARLVGCCGEDAARVAELPGSGAAGGLGWALQFFLDARLRPGLDLVAELVGLDEQLAGADLLLTAEGSVDQQTPHGKAIQRICEHAERAGVPVIVFGGRVDLETGRLPGQVVELVTITPPGTPLAQALRQGPQNLRRAVVEALRRWSSL